ncbi:MAG: CDP-glucose 4,6-dehydratase [Chitinispirillaceae bacterium]
MENLFGGIYKNRKVLVTGHTGFKGSWLSLWLKSMGAKVGGYSLGAPTEPDHLSLLDLDMESHIGDILDTRRLESFIMSQKPQIVFHLAAQPLVRLSYKEPVSTFMTNVIGTLNVLEACRKSGCVKACVVITSDKVYENREWVWGYRETDPFGGYDPYSASKGCTEIAVSSFRRSFVHPDSFGKTHSMLVASVRAGNVIGGGDWAQDRLIPDIVKASSRGEQVVIRSPGAVRPWQHVLECLSGYLMVGQKLLEEDVRCAEGWNFGPSDDDALTVEQVLALVKKCWPEMEYRIEANGKNPHEARYLKLDTCKARGDLGWRTLWDAGSAIEKTVEWYREYYRNGTVLSEQNLSSYIDDAGKKGVLWAQY